MNSTLKPQITSTVVLTLAAGLALTVPAAEQDPVLALRGGTIHTLVGDSIEDGTVLIRGNRIVAVGTGINVPAGADFIDASGMHILPGLFDAVTRVGLTEIGAVDVTSDFSELGDNNPHLLAFTAVHPASEIIPVTRANGITHAVAAPAGAGLAGQGSLINLDGWTIEEMLLSESVYMVVSWPALGGEGQRGGGRRGGNQQSFSERKATYDKQIHELEELLDQARQYAGSTTTEPPGAARDRKLEALGRVISGELPMLVTTNSERGIRDAVAFGVRSDVRVIIGGGSQAWKVADLLVEHDVAVILGATQSMPPGPNDPYDAAYSHPGKLYAAGVRFAISTYNASSARTLPYEAGMAVPYGLPHAEAVKSITLYPAQILGLDEKLGTLEAGKLANLIVTDGDPLDIQTDVVHLIINGHITSTDNKHQQLYEKYRSRPQRDGIR